MSVSYLWVGATTHTAVVVKARVTGESARLHVAESNDLSSPVTSDEVAVDNGVAALGVDGLEPGTRYYYGVEIDGDLDTDTTGRFRTHPRLGKPAEFTVAAASCAGWQPEHPGEGDVAVPDRISNHPVFSTIRDRDPLMFLHMGDMHYYNIGSGDFVPGHDADTFRGAFDDVFAQSHQAALYRDVAIQYMWDDHDYGPNNSDSTAPGRKAAAQVFRERVPHYELSDEIGVWHSWTIGRILFVAWDLRSHRSPNDDPDGADKTMLGTAQKAWLHSVLKSSNAAFLVVVSSNVWFEDVADSWGSFETERAEIIGLFDSTGWAGRMCIVSGDLHAVAMDSGGNSPGGVPLFQFAGFDSKPAVVQDHYDLGPTKPGRAQYGELSFTDAGDEVTVTATAYRGEDEIMSHTLTAAVPEELRDAGETASDDSGTSWWSKLMRFFRGLFTNS